MEKCLHRHPSHRSNPAKFNFADVRRSNFTNPLLQGHAPLLRTFSHIFPTELLFGASSCDSFGWGQTKNAPEIAGQRRSEGVNTGKVTVTPGGIEPPTHGLKGCGRQGAKSSPVGFSGCFRGREQKGFAHICPRSPFLPLPVWGNERGGARGGCSRCRPAARLRLVGQTKNALAHLVGKPHARLVHPVHDGSNALDVPAAFGFEQNAQRAPHRQPGGLRHAPRQTVV